MTATVERPTEPLHRVLGLTDGELEAIRDRLAREPNDLELAMFSVMWSEHCSYKSSRPLLRTLPTTGEGLVAGPGESAGAVSIGDGLAVAFKIESHNHPSAVEPVQGAMTGVGGILRDIFAMGARPIAVLDALRFGDPASPRTRRLVDGVVRGVGGYGNCVGVPTVGGELVFDPAYEGNPLVNVMAIGLLDEARLTHAAAPGPGNLVVLYGSTTGRDGIGGASVLASATFGADAPSRRPSVQVGDPFAEKLLIEASLELVERGLVEGLQDLGAAGITCAVSETADRSGTGIAVDLDAIPRREPGLEPFEVMISESQERMLAIVRPERWDAVREVCERWGLPVAVVGRVTDDADVTVVAGGIEPDGRPAPGAAILARIPARALASDAIVHHRLALAPTRRRAAPAPGEPAGAPPAVADVLPERGMDPGAVLAALLGRPNLASRRWVFEQYDWNVGAATIAGPGRGAAVVRVNGTRKVLVASTDAVAPIGALDPWLGAALSVAEATRNVAITGARSLGVTNCLNFGDPTRPEAFWQLSEAVRGLGDACRALGLPVTGGNVSLYNESSAGTILPTPEIGVVGLLDDLDDRVGPGFAADGDVILLLGEVGAGLAGSEYARLAGAAADDDPPSLDLERERALQAFLVAAARRRLLTAAQDVSAGGVAIALAEMAIWGGRGADVRLQATHAPAVELFGESPSRAIVTVRPSDVDAVVELAVGHGLPTAEMGRVGGRRLRIDLAAAGATGAAEERGGRIADALDVAVADLAHAWEAGLPRALGLDTGDDLASEPG
ncbi:MAG TPA: phosphoribosylformylglycinamidine synthase subunit PurL [Candidatus Limnocylindrales bacterium]|nr:phosphoribosylformylglycinamidine synthase subunit PurL [Candidatus Limnocylindrales bacterium]